MPSSVRCSRLADRPSVHWIVITAEPVTDVDVTGAEAISSVLDELDRSGVVLALADLNGPVRDRLPDQARRADRPRALLPDRR